MDILFFVVFNMKYWWCYNKGNSDIIYFGIIIFIINLDLY